MPFPLGLVAGVPWVVGLVRELVDWVKGRASDTIAHLDAVAHEALAQIGVAELPLVNISPASVEQAAAAFRAAMPNLSDAALRPILAQTHLESGLGKGDWGDGCWNMGAEQCPGGQPGADYTCVDHGDQHADKSHYTAKYKCFSSQQAAAAGYLRLLTSARFVDAFNAAEKGDVLGFVHGLYIHKDAAGHPEGGWFEGIGSTDEQRWGGYLARLLARLPAIDAGLGVHTGGKAAAMPRPSAPAPSTAPARAPAPTPAPALPSYPNGVTDGRDTPAAPDVSALAQAAQKAGVPAAVVVKAQQAAQQANLPAGTAAEAQQAAEQYLAQNPGAGYTALGTPASDAVQSDVAAATQPGGPQYAAHGGQGPTPGTEAPADSGPVASQYMAHGGQGPTPSSAPAPAAADGPGVEQYTATQGLDAVPTGSLDEGEATVGGVFGVVVGLFVAALAAVGVVAGYAVVKVVSLFRTLAAAGIQPVPPGSAPPAGSALVDATDPALVLAFEAVGHPEWLSITYQKGWTYARSSLPTGARVSGVAGVPNETGTWRDATNADVEADDVVGAYKALLTKPVGTSKIEEHNGRVWRLRAVSKDTDPKFTRHRRDVRGWIFQCASSDPGIALEDGHWRDATDDDVAADQTLDTYNSLLAKPVGTEAHEEHNGRIWRFRVVSSTTDPQFTTHARDVRGWVWTCADEPSLLDSVLSAAGLLDAPARVAGGAGSQDLRGLMLEAVRAGRALNTDSLVEVDVRELDLVITVPRRAFRAPVRGYDKPLLLGWSYANLIEVCRLLGMIPLTREMVDAVWAAPFTWRITATGLWAPGADLAMQRVEYAAKQTDTVDAAIQALDNGNGAPPDAVIRDEGKAWIIHEDLPKSAGAVLYGWHDARSGKVLQGLGRGHDADWDDYSMVDPPAQRMARRLSTGEPIDLLAFYRQHFPDPAMQPFLDVFEGVPA